MIIVKQILSFLMKLDQDGNATVILIPKLYLWVNLSRFHRLRSMFNSMSCVALNVNATFTMDPNTTKKSFFPS